MDGAQRLLVTTKLLSERRQGDFIRRFWHTDWCPLIPARYVVAAMMFLGFVNVYILRVNLSMALVVMVNDSSSNNSDKIQPHPVGLLVKCV